MYNLDEVSAFVHVMQSGSLTRSARQLGLAKSTLSRRIGQLERQLGQSLLRRQSNRLLPTEAGRLFHGYGLRMLTLAEQGQRALDELRQEVSGELAVEAHGALARHWLAESLALFLEAHPGIRLTLRSRRSPPLFAEGEAVMLWLGELPETELRQETLAWLERGLYAHPAYLAQRGAPAHPRELARHRWVDRLGETAHGLTLRHREVGEYRFQPPALRFQSDQPELHGDAIAQGEGLGILPHWLAERHATTGFAPLERCLPQWSAPPLAVTLLYPHGQLPRRLMVLLDHLRQGVPHAWRTPAAARAACQTNPCPSLTSP